MFPKTKTVVSDLHLYLKNHRKGECPWPVPLNEMSFRTLNRIPPFVRIGCLKPLFFVSATLPTVHRS